MYSFILFVNLPVHTISKPVANGSSVPACPTFFIRIRFLIFLTTSNDVHSIGLSINNTCPSSKILIGLFIPANVLLVDGCWMLDTGYWILDTRYWMLVAVTSETSSN